MVWKVLSLYDCLNNITICKSIIIFNLLHNILTEASCTETYVIEIDDLLDERMLNRFYWLELNNFKKSYKMGTYFLKK